MYGWFLAASPGPRLAASRCINIVELKKQASSLPAWKSQEMSQTYNMLDFVLLLRCPLLPSSQDTGFSHLPFRSPIGLFPVPQTGLRVYVQFPLPGVLGLLPHDEFCLSSPLELRMLGMVPLPRGHPHCGTPTMSRVVCFSLWSVSLWPFWESRLLCLFTCFFSFLHQTVSSVGVSETEGFECFFTLLTSSLAHLSQLHGYWQKTWDSWVRNTQWSNSGGSVSFRLLHQLPSSVKFRLMLHTQGWHHSSGTLCLRNPNHLSRAASKPDLGLGGSHLYYMT